ncbi:MAG TPA: efflux transporter outer membrane subunit [Thermodesulfovibrionales bacterium]|nr:efflux transporter outer membrane subunit [Thermodesulfovibrionales bacterium]
MRKGILLLSFILITSGCMVGPNYQRPQVDTPQTWRFEDKEAKDVANTAWWEQFNDPVLNDLIHVALEENKDVKIAAARVEQFIGQYETTRAALFPQVSAGALYGRQRVSQLTGPLPLQESPGSNPTFNSSELFLNASWEIDLWGKLRRATEAARANLLSTEEARRTVILTLVSSVANAYVNLRDLDKQLEITRQTAVNYKEGYDIFNLRFEYGIVSEVEVNMAKAQYEQALANIPFYEKIIAQQENALSVLLGRNPGSIPRGKTIDELMLPAVPSGLPSDILVNRPDIRQAEENLIAANANIGVAKAQYYPTISLTGALGLASNNLSDLFKGPAKTWSWAVPLAAPIFTGGAIAGQVKSAEAVQQQAVLIYQQAIQTAFREVDDALVDQWRTREELAALVQEVGALRSYADLAWLRYENGYTSYLEVLDANTRLYTAELIHAQRQGTLFEALVNLYKAMGGGWVVKADEMTVVSGTTSGTPTSSTSGDGKSEPH